MKHLRLRVPAACALLLFILLGSSVAAAQQTPPARRANARKLLRVAEEASRQLLQAGQGRLDRNARSRPFWDALRQMDAQLDQVGSGLRTRDLSFFRALRSGTASLAELQVTWAQAGLQDPAVDQSLRVLAAAFGRLRNRYGPEWVRFQTGRPLSEDERLRFARMRAGQAQLADTIAPLRDRAARAGDDATLNELTLLLMQIHGVATAPSTLGDYLDASVATDSIRGAWYGARAAHAPGEAGWAEADQAVSDITTDDSVGLVFTTDLSTVKDWSFVDEETEIPAEVAEADAGTKNDAMTPGQVVELGAVEERDQVDPTDPSDDPSDLIDSAISLEEPEVQTLGEEPVEEMSPETVPGAEKIEEEDLQIEPPPAGDADFEPCTAESTKCVDDGAVVFREGESAPPPAASPAAPPPTAPARPPIG